MQTRKDRESIGLFLVITFVLSSICYYIRIMGGENAAGMTAVLMWCPAIAAFIVKRIYYPKEIILGWNACKAEFIVYSVIIPVIYLACSYGVYWIINPNAFTGELYSNSIFVMLALIPSSLLTATGEEIGWRGFLLPKMTKVWNLKIAIIVSGLIWAVWHFAIMIAGLYQSGTVIWYQLPMFAIEIIVMTTIMAYLRMESKSVWPAIILHASHNYFDQTVFGPLTKADMKSYFIGETGFVTAIFMIGIVFIMTRRFKSRSPK